MCQVCSWAVAFTAMSDTNSRATETRTSNDATIWSQLERQVLERPNEEFCVDDHDRSLTFADAHVCALRIAALLEENGAHAGTVVSWQFPNVLEAMVLTLALSRLGAIQSPLISILREREVKFICAQANSQLLVVPSGDVGTPFRALAANVAAGEPSLRVLVLPDDVLQPLDTSRYRDAPTQSAPVDSNATSWYFYTSGTTADPKGAKHSDASMIAGSKGFIEALTITASDRVSLIIPVTHVGGIIHVIATVLTGAPMLIAAAFNPMKTIEFLRRQRASTVPGSMPFVHAYMAYADSLLNVPGSKDIEPLFPHARFMTHGGSPKPPQLHYRVKERFGTAGIISGYGMTECPMTIWNRPEDDDDDLATTEGRPVTGVELRIMSTDAMSDAAVRCDVGVEGEIRLRGPQLMQGYVDASLDHDAFDAEGFFRSGDLGIVNSRGRLLVTGRLKDIIIRNMENISALEVENLLFTHPKVKEVAVIGVPDERTGERVCAVVVSNDPADPPNLKELTDHLLTTGLSTRKFPERLELVDALPRNAMEKIRKVDLRERFSK
jgi:acyl-CoA synthetase (AMP-forming)/AMP-acid ligase II